MDDWRDEAACRGKVALMFPDGHNRTAVAAAKAVCSVCAVCAQCREVSRNEEFGVWGGLSANERIRGRSPSPPRKLRGDDGRLLCYCGNRFVASAPNQRFCSKRCRDRAWRWRKVAGGDEREASL